MTPLQLFLISVVVCAFCMMFDNDNKAPNWVKALGGVSIIVIFCSIIWGIFYYVKI